MTTRQAEFDRLFRETMGTWNRCDVCGRFIAFDDFDHGAIRELITPDSHFTHEEYETLCIGHADENHG